MCSQSTGKLLLYPLVEDGGAEAPDFADLQGANVPLRAILWSVLGWSSKIAAAWPESSSGSGKNAPGNTACKRALGGSASETALG